MSAADTIWVTVPQRVAKRWPAGGAVLADGAWLRVVPAAAVIGPIVAFALGFWIGGFRDETYETYTYSVGLLCILTLPACFGAGLGFASLAGYVLGDLFLFDHHVGADTFPDGLDHLTRWLVPLLVTYLLLAILLVGAPAIGAAFRFQVQRVLKGQPPGVRFVAATAANVAGVVLTAWSWISVMPVLIRPPWLWADLGQPTDPFLDLQDIGNNVIVFMGVAVAVRSVVAHLAEQRVAAAASASATSAAPGATQAGDAATRPRRTFRRFVRPSKGGPPVKAATEPFALPSLPTRAVRDKLAAGAGAVATATAPPSPAERTRATVVSIVVAVVAGMVLTMLISGLLGTWGDVALSWAAFTVAILLRRLVLPSIPGYAKLVNKIPMVARVLVAVIVARAIGDRIVQHAFDEGETSDLVPLMQSLLASVVLSSFLFPSRKAVRPAPPAAALPPSPAPTPAATS
jgi:hypothetical protein